MKIRHKLTLSFVILVLFIALANVMTTAYVFQSLQGERLKSTELPFLKRLADNIYRDVIEQNIDPITDQLFDEKSYHSDIISYILVFDEKGYLLAHTFLTAMPKVLLNLNQTIDPAKGYRIDHIHNSQINVYDMAVPILEGIRRVGTIHLGIKSSYIDNIVTPTHKASTYMILFTFLMILISMGIAGALSQAVTGPVDALHRGVNRIIGGNWDSDIKAQSNDEIGQLSIAFNRMLSDLKVSRQMLEEANSSLEEKVVRRTEELRRNQEKTRLIIDTAEDAFISMDEQGRITDWNKAAESMFGWGKTEIMGQPMAEAIIPPEGRSAYAQGLTHFLQTTESAVLGKRRELSAVRRNGQEFPIEILVWTYQTEEGYQFNAFIRDISDRKKVEEEMQQAQGQLIQSEKLASIGHLAAGVAHEINNPVGFVSSNLQTLEEYLEVYLKVLRLMENIKDALLAKNEKKARELLTELSRIEKESNLEFIMGDVETLLEESKRGLERVKKIVLDLRTFAREDRGHMEKVKVEEIIDGILSIVHNEIKYKAQLKTVYGETPSVYCNAQKIGQVFMNLVINASQAIEENGEITIRTYKKGEHVCVEVGDTGKGIAPDKVSKIFEPFYTSKPVGEGTGLGLSLSYDIVKKHGGGIRVKSEEGKGTVFTVILPIEGREDA